MKNLIIILLIVLQSYVKVGDRKEYQKYKDYCNEFVAVDVHQWCKFRLKLLPDSTWIDSTGYYERDSAYKIFWYKPYVPKYADDTTKVVVFNTEANEHGFGYAWQVRVRRRKHSVRDFYEYWMTDSIKH